MGILWGVATARVPCFSAFPVGVSLRFVLLSNSLKIYLTKVTWNYISLQLRQANGSSHAWNNFDFWCHSARLILSSSGIKITIVWTDAISPRSDFKKDPAPTPTNDLEGVLGWKLPLGVRLIFSFLSCTLAYRANINARSLSILRVLIQLIYSALRSIWE